MFSEQMRSLETMLEFAVATAYEKGGIEEVYNVVSPKEKAKAKAIEREGKKFNEMEFNLVHLASMLMVSKTALSLKSSVKSQKDRLYIAGKLIECAKELKNLK